MHSKSLLRRFPLCQRRNNPQELVSNNIQKDLGPQRLPMSPNQVRATTLVFADTDSEL